VIGSVDDMLLTKFDDLDQTSLVFTVTVGGKKMIFSGDAGPQYIGQYISKRYTAATLKCDIVQATSHGQNGDALTNYYKMADADYYLWSATKDFYGRHTPNKYIEGDKSAKIIYSFDGAYTVELK
jgi:beta-lactamase superfamily II metal-dependent hydrolase